MESLVNSSTKKSHFIKLLKLLLSYSITLIFITVLYKQLNFHYLSVALTTVPTKDLFLAIFFLIVAYVLRGIRWGLMLKMLDPKNKLLKSQHVFWLSMAINNVLPFRMGDMYRIFALRGRTSLTPASILGTLILERLLDLFILLSLFVITLHWVKIDVIPQSFIHLLQVLIFLCAIILVCLLIMPTPAKIFLAYLSNRYSNKSSLVNKILQQGESFIEAVLLLRSFSTTITLLVICLFAWLSESLVFVFAAHGVNANQGLIGPVFASSVGALSTLIPSAPGYIGTFDYFTMLGLRAFGSPVDTATAAALLSHLILWLPVTVYGLIYYIFYHLLPDNLLKTFRKAQNSEKKVETT